MIYLIMSIIEHESRDPVRAFTKESDAQAFLEHVQVYHAARPYLGSAEENEWRKLHPAGAGFTETDLWCIDTVPLDDE